MSAQRSTEYQKPKFNVYTMMLILSLMALVTGCILLYLELQPYGEFMKWWDTSGV
ncbi:MAG: hypothetical protein KY475_02695 [Planctomycetes bacterium]|nr:hypothetical protein [Planctomycetota bacterium]